jgi:hypothetical protein
MAQVTKWLVYVTEPSSTLFSVINGVWDDQASADAWVTAVTDQDQNPSQYYNVISTVVWED